MSETVEDAIHFLCPKHQPYERNGTLAMVMLVSCLDCANLTVSRIEGAQRGLQSVLAAAAKDRLDPKE